MTTPDLLIQLQPSFAALTSQQTEAFIAIQDQVTRQQYEAKVMELRIQIISLYDGELTVLADALDKLAPDLQSSLFALKQAVTDLANAVAILTALDSVVSFLTKVVVAVPGI